MSTSRVPRTAAAHARRPYCANEIAAVYMIWPLLLLPRVSGVCARRYRHVDAPELGDRHILDRLLLPPTEHDAMSTIGRDL